MRASWFLGLALVGCSFDHGRVPGDATPDVPSNADSALFGTNITDYWFPVSQGGDIAFLYGVLKILVERNWLNDEFISRHTAGFEDLKSQIANLKFDGIVLSNINPAQIDRRAEQLAQFNVPVLRLWHPKFLKSEEAAICHQAAA